MSKYVISTWEPETSSFWQNTGKTTANWNLWISIPALLLWLQNAGFILVPFIAATTLMAWFGMNDIASVADQAVIFKRKHNWPMCWLYTGTFGSFIAYSAGSRC
jgi:nitrate/nitrite transporter NarK